MTYDELSVIKQAVINEIEGYDFYTMAAKQASSTAAQEAYKQLAEEEFMHVRWLKEFYENLAQGKEHALHLAFVIDPPSPKLFDWVNVDRDGASMALSVFGIGIQMEKASVKFYEKAKQNTQVSKLKQLYTALARWEKVHLEQFEQQYEHLKEEWWNKQGYAPF